MSNMYQGKHQDNVCLNQAPGFMRFLHVNSASPKLLTKPAEIARWQWHLSQGKTNDTFTPWKSDRIFFRFWFQGENDGVKNPECVVFPKRNNTCLWEQQHEKKKCYKTKTPSSGVSLFANWNVDHIGTNNAKQSKHEGSQFSRNNSHFAES